MQHSADKTSKYKKNSLTLVGAVALGTGVMIGAGIFALTGQMAEMTGVLFPLAFLFAALIVAFSAYSYVKMSNAYPDAGGIGMYLYKAYGDSLSTAFNALLMYFSMVIAQSFLARTFGATALGILAFKGFTTITNSGSELKDPHHNVGRAIIISIALCVVIYTLVGFAVSSNLSLSQIIATQDYSLAAAAKPLLGGYGLYFTVVLAMLATAGGVIASIFAVSRMLAMLTEMKLVPHSHFGMPGSIQKHTLVYTVVLGLLLTMFFDLSRIAALGIVFYLIMDIAVHWGILRYLRKDIGANSAVLITAILLDLLVLCGFIWVKITSDPLVIAVAILAMATIAIGEALFLKNKN